MLIPPVPEQEMPEKGSLCGTTVLWAFEDVKLDLGKDLVIQDLTSDTSISASTINGLRHHVYLAPAEVAKAVR